MNVTIFKVVFLSIIGIGHSQDWNIVDLGPFSVELPNGFKKESLGSPDSYAMKIEIDSTIFYFDYGYYSPQITLTAKEYITSEKWIYSGDFDLLFLDKANIKIISVDSIGKYLYRATFDISKILEDDSSFYNCNRELFTKVSIKDSFYLTGDIVIPEVIKNTDFYDFSTNEMQKRVVVPKCNKIAKSGVHLIDTRKCKDLTWCNYQLTFWLNRQSNMSDEDVFKIYKSIILE